MTHGASDEEEKDESGLGRPTIRPIGIGPPTAMKTAEDSEGLGDGIPGSNSGRAIVDESRSGQQLNED